MPEQEHDDGGRGLWSGTISFGLVTVPVNLLPANRPGGVHSRMLDADGTPLRRRYYCSTEDREIDRSELVRGYQVREGELIIVSDEELQALDPRKSQDIDLRLFVDESEIEPLLFERSYFLTPGGNSNKAYRLLAEVMGKTHKVGIATFVMREKEYLIAILAERGILRAETLRFEDEVRTPADVGLRPGKAVDKKRVARMKKEIEKLRKPDVDPASLTNEYAGRVLELLERKRERNEDLVRTRPVEADEPEADLMHTLKLSLAGETSRGKTARPRRGLASKRPTPTAVAKTGDRSRPSRSPRKASK